MNHTPGPWKVTDKDGDIIPVRVEMSERTSYEICAVSDDHADDEEQEANARLIAAAPEMLEALRSLSALVALGPTAWDESAPVIHEARRQAQAAIAKATNQPA